MKKTLVLITFFFCMAGAPWLAAQEETVSSPVQDAKKVLAVNAAIQESSPLENTAVNLQTATFQLRYVRPQTAADQVRDLMGASQGGVIVNEPARQLEVSAPADTLEKIKSLISDLDKQRDISFDVKVVQVDLNEEHLPGINWSAIVSDFKSFTVSEDKRKFSAGTISSEDMAVLLEALGTVGETNEFPVSVAKINNGQEADLRLKAFDRDVSVNMKPMLAASPNVSEKQDRYTARLVLSPTASNNDAVDLRIVSVDGAVVTMHVKNNNVAVIGGIFTQTKSESTKKFPFLGDLPLFGVVFRDQSKVVHRLENIIFLTPHVSTPSTITLTK